jgi:uncharacterized membrane protein YraQ (UPF0718 family)
VTPFCSCSSIPLFIGFTSAGLPVGVTFSFLISSPMVDLGSLVLLMSIFGAKVAVVYVIFGLIVAVIGGTIIEKLHMERYVEDFIKNASEVDIESPELTWRDRVVYAKDQVRNTFKKVFPYILVGVGIGAVIHNWIPEARCGKGAGRQQSLRRGAGNAHRRADVRRHFRHHSHRGSAAGKGAQLGTVLSFMMAVTTLSLPSMIMLRKAVKPKLLGLFIAICTVGIIIVGYLFNVLQPFLI